MATKKPVDREVVFLGKKIKVRRVVPSNEAIKSLGLRNKRDFIGHIAINPPNIEKEYRMIKANILREMAMMNPKEREQFIAKGPIDFVKDKSGLKRYEITCARCGDKVAYCWAINEKLDNWCDLHYYTWFDKSSWRGAMVINVSPIDGKIGIECSCGEDTRDFRVNQSLPPIPKQLMIEYSQKHRDFATPDSRFVAVAK